MEIKYKKITSRTLGDRVIHMIIVPIFDSKRCVRYMLGIADDVTDEATTLKRDLIFSITRSDILDQSAIIMTYLERAQLKTTHEEMQMFFDKTIGSVESIKNQIAVRTGLAEPRGDHAPLAVCESGICRSDPDASVSIPSYSDP